MRPLKALLISTLASAVVLTSGWGCATNNATPAPENRTKQTQPMPRPITPVPAPLVGKKMAANKSETVLRADCRKAANAVPGVAKSSVVIMKPTMTALVGITLDSGKSPASSRKVMDATAKRVEKVPTIRNAYVTADPALVKRVEMMAKDIAAGKPVSGMTREWNEIITRITPK